MQVEAIEEYRSLIDEDGNYPEYRIELARVHLARGEYSLAWDELTAALRLDSAILEAHYLLGVCAEELNRDSAPSFEFAYRFAPHDPTFALAWAISLVSSGRCSEALIALKGINMALADKELTVNIVSTQAEALMSMGHPNAARQVLKNAIDLAGPHEQLEENCRLVEQAIGAAA